MVVTERSQRSMPLRLVRGSRRCELDGCAQLSVETSWVIVHCDIPTNAC